MKIPKMIENFETIQSMRKNNALFSIIYETDDEEN